MPRPTPFYAAKVATLKRPETDIFADFKKICSVLLEEHKKVFIDPLKEELNDAIRSCRSFQQPLTRKNRVYITTPHKTVALMMVDLPDPVLENLKNTFDFINNEYDKDFYFLYANLWIFEGPRLTKWEVIKPKTLAELMVVFGKENLIDYNTRRYEWLTKPVLQARPGYYKRK